MVLKGCRLICLFLALPLVFACLVEELSCLDRYWDRNPVPSLFFAGFAGAVVVYFVIRQTPESVYWGFDESFVHELAHMVMTFLTLSRVIEFVARVTQGPKVKPEKGHVNPTGENFLSILAPYYLPTFTIPFLIARLFTGYSAARVLNLFVGATLGYHYILFVVHFGRSLAAKPELSHDGVQKIPDTKKVGEIFALLFCTIANVLILLLVFNIVWGAEKRVMGYHFVEIFLRAFRYYKELLILLKSLLDQLFMQGFL